MSGGRPTLNEDERRCKQAKIRLTIAEHCQASADARAAGISLAEFVRRRLLGQSVRPPSSVADARLLFELNAIGVNLNQLTKNVNSERAGRHTISLDQLQTELQRVLARVGDALE